MTICYLGIGSNLENPFQQVTRALQKISAISSTTILRQSPWYANQAIGLNRQPDTGQPDYINGVIEIESSLEPHQLLRALQQIEQAQGRTREVRWGARTLDIDILLYGDQRIHSDHLDIPHPRILERNFVFIPLADLNPNLPLALLRPHATTHNPNAAKNETIASMLGSPGREGLRLVDEHSIHKQSLHE